jgi:hypothetical protein
VSWLRIDDHFEEHEKVDTLSDAAHRLWFRCACWCKRPENEHLQGFVPLRIVVKMAGSPALATKLSTELVEARGEPAYGHEHGLWEPREGGWQFHDWADYQPPKGEKRSRPTTSERSEAARRAGKASAEARRAANGTAQPVRPNGRRTTPERRSTERTPNDSRTAFDRTDAERLPNGRRTTPEPPDPDPDPDQPETTTQRPDSLERSERPSGVVVVAENQLIPCPPDLDLTPEQRASLEVSPGIPGWAVDEIRAAWVTGELGDQSKTMTLAQWRKCLSQVCCSRWNNPARRPKRPEQPEPEHDSGDVLAEINQRLGYQA